MKILDKEYDIDFYDADIIEKIENGMDKVSKVVNQNSKIKEQKTSTVIREVCNVIFNFFDSVLGEGASKDIFGNKTSLKLCIKAYEDIINEKKKQDTELENISKKYSVNRATRRSKK